MSKVVIAPRPRFIWLTTLIVFAVVSTSCAARQNYQNASQGFAIQYPTSWSVEESDQSRLVTLGRQVHINIHPYETLLANDLLGHLEAMTEANLEPGIFVEVGQPESIRLYNYRAARITTIAKTQPGLISVPSGPGKEPVWVFNDAPTDIIVITDGVQVATIFVVWPDATTEWVIQSFRFCCE